METNNETQLVIYQTPNGETQLDVTVRGETIWLTQRQIADLFGTKVPAISKHLKNIFASGELDRDATISKMETVQDEGGRSVRRTIDFYNPTMGLTAWKGAPDGKILKSDVLIAKNYLNEKGVQNLLP